MNNPDVYLPEGYFNYPTTKDIGSTYTYDRIEKAENVIRKDKIWYPENTGNYGTNGNKTLRFELPDHGCYDFQRSVIYADITITQSAPALVDPWVSLPNGVFNIFERIRHLDGASPVEDRNDSNIIESFWWLFQQEPIVFDTLGQDMFGFGLDSERRAWATTTKRYAIPYSLEFLRSGIMPLKKFGKQFVEFYLAPVDTFIETNGAGTVVTLSNISWHFTMIEGESYCRALYSDVDAGKFHVSFNGWQLFQNSPLAINNNLVISHRAKSFKGVFTVFQQKNDYNNTNPGYQKFWTYPKLDCVDYQYRILGDLWPELPVDCRGNGERNYIDYCKWVNAWYADGHSKEAPNVQIAEFNTTSFVIMGDFMNDPHLVDRPHVINNISTQKMQTDLQLNVRFGTAPPAGYVANHLIQYSIKVHCPGEKMPFKVDF